MFMPPEMEIARQWAAKAKNDILDADNNLASRNVPFNMVCFHCQQAAEKMLKAFLAARGVPPPHVHDLLALLTHVLRLDFSAEALRDPLASLNPY